MSGLLVVWGGGTNGGSGGRGDCGKAGFDGKAGTGPGPDADASSRPGPGADWGSVLNSVSIPTILSPLLLEICEKSVRDVLISIDEIE